MRILAVDPGLHVGWATLDKSGNFAAGELEFTDIMHKVSAFLPEVLVVERFVIMPKTKNVPHALKVIGMLEWWAEERSIPFVEQQGVDAKRFADNDRLKRLGWYTKGSDHARMATRHLVKYLAATNYSRLPKEVPMCTCSPRERIPNGDDPDRCFRCAQPIPEVR